METNKNIKHQINKTLTVLDNLDVPKTLPFFKDRTMQLLFADNEEKQTVYFWNWFTPKLQLATLACVVLINVYAIKQINDDNTEEAISSFAVDYGLTASTESSLFNL